MDSSGKSKVDAQAGSEYSDHAHYAEENSENLTVELPDHLVEKIVSRIPFPFIFKTRVLSKSWYCKFPLGSDCKTVRYIFPSPFLDEIKSLAFRNWISYCPAFVSSGTCGACLTGFDRRSETWQSFPIHCAIPLDSKECVLDSNLGGCIMSSSEPSKAGSGIIMANVLTGSWRRLPDCPEPVKNPTTLVIPVGSDGYKLLLYELGCDKDDRPDCRVQLYDSTTSEWSGNSAHLIFKSLSTQGVYLSGDLYNMYVWPRQRDHMVILKYNLESGELTHSAYRLKPRKEKLLSCGMFLCSSKVFLTTVSEANSSDRCRDQVPWQRSHDIRARVYELNVKSLKLSEASESPQEMLVQDVFTTFASNPDCIYYCGIFEDEGQLSLSSYSICEQMWLRHSVSPPKEYLKLLKWKKFSCLQPGLNPFSRV